MPPRLREGYVGHLLPRGPAACSIGEGTEGPGANAMPSQRTDQIARAAARLISTGRARTIAEALRAARETMGWHDVQMPAYTLVRKHAGAMAMQAMGAEGYAERVRQVLRVAERLMTVLTEGMPDIEPLLVGRVAKGLIDAGATIHIRLYTRAPIADVARALIGFGYEEPDFETINTRHGRLNRMRMSDDGIDVVLTRCLPEMEAEAHVDLFTGRPIETATLHDLRKKLAEGE